MRVSVRGAAGSRDGLRPVVYVRVGNGPRIPVLLDTGSTGLSVYPSGLDLRRGGGVSLAGASTNSIYGDGTTLRDQLAQARVTIGGLTTTRAVEMAVIRGSGCIPAKPHCPRELLTPRAGIQGILGISLGPAGDGTENPLLSLPEPYSRSWSLGLSGDRGTLELAAPSPRHPTVALRLSPQGIIVASRPRTYEDVTAGLCWQLGDHRACPRTAFDSGTGAMTWFQPVPSPELSRRPGEPPVTVPGVLGSGGVVSAAVGPAVSPFWRFIAGTTISRNLVIRQPVDQELLSQLDPGASILDSTGTPSRYPSLTPLSWPATGILDTGVQAFYVFRITYDALGGRLYLTPSPTSSPESRLVSGAYLAANRRCIRYYAVAERMLAASPPAHQGDLRSLERRAAYQMSHWAALSLSADRVLETVRLPGSAERLWQQALASDRAGARVMLATAPRLTSYRTRKSYRSASVRYAALYNRAEAGWNQNMKALGLGGCDP